MTCTLTQKPSSEGRRDRRLGGCRAPGPLASFLPPPEAVPWTPERHFQDIAWAPFLKCMLPAPASCSRPSVGFIPFRVKPAISEFPVHSITHPASRLLYDHVATWPRKPGGQPGGGALNRVRVFREPKGLSTHHWRLSQFPKTVPTVFHLEVLVSVLGPVATIIRTL